MQAFSRRFPTAGFPSPILRALTFLLSDLQTSLTSQFEKSLPDLRALPNLTFSMVRLRKHDNREVSEAPEIRENDLRERSERSGDQRGEQ
ncbi:hypothetical protein RCIA11 [Methanocella arvoryzae MRE50]|uniref:Uncharacterized protein n=1 Tax=Methanocella arvoryzae (strain DSM 22066 / NBRC 105507 / MRE50) TaxID=351160 RepID=Q0W7A8_METAR|nr:hypothetical protein RCIA11 [Methanocella arvoryzae MRE50]